MPELIVVTGASRGLGKAIALGLANAFPTAEFIFTSTKLPDLELASKSTYDRVIVILNHGTLSQLTGVTKFADKAADILRDIDVNFSSGLLLSSAALQAFPANITGKLDIVNISTLAAIKPFVNWGVYCATKAGRDMISQVIKEEAALEQNPDRVKTLNYAPGPLDTDMQTIIRATDDHVPQRDAFRKMHDEGTLIKPDVSAGKLIALLVSRTFQSGSHVDFYDI